MTLVSTEYKKIIHSPLVWIGTALGFIVLLALYIGFRVKGTDLTSLQFISITLGNLNNLGLFQLMTAIAAGIAFASEYTYGTFRYIRIRPVNIFSLYFSKLAGCGLYLLVVTCFILFASTLLGTISWGGRNLYSMEGTALSNPGLRILLFYFFTLFNQFFMVTLTMFFSLKTKKLSNAILTAYTLYVLMLIFVPESISHLTPKGSIALKECFVTSRIRFGDLLISAGITLGYSAVLCGASLLLILKEEEHETSCV